MSDVSVQKVPDHGSLLSKGSLWIALQMSQFAVKDQRLLCVNAKIVVRIIRLSASMRKETRELLAGSLYTGTCSSVRTGKTSALRTRICTGTFGGRLFFCYGLLRLTRDLPIVPSKDGIAVELGNQTMFSLAVAPDDTFVEDIKQAGGIFIIWPVTK